VGSDECSSVKKDCWLGFFTVCKGTWLFLGSALSSSIWR